MAIAFLTRRIFQICSLTPRALGLLLFALLAFTLHAPSASAAALTWTGQGGNTDFTTAGNWSPAQTPTAADDCTINTTAGAPNNQPTLSSNATCGSLVLGNGAQLMTLTMSGNRTLSIVASGGKTGNVTIGANGRIANSGASGVFTIEGNWSDTIGTTNITDTAMMVSYNFTGSAKTITTDDNFYSATISGSYTLAGTSNINIYNLLDIPNNGTASLAQAANSRISLRGPTFSVNGPYTYAGISTAYLDVYSAWSPAAIHWPNLTVKSGATVTGSNGTIVDYNLTVESGGTLVTGQNLTIGGNFLNNGGTVNSANSIVTMSDAAFAVTASHAQIGGTASTTFKDLNIGDGSGTDSVTVALDTTMTGNLTVATGATMTVTGGKNISVLGGGTTISGTMTLSGATTFTQEGGSNAKSIKVYGTLNATGTDTSNRVTFTGSGATTYDFVSFAGSTVNFDKVNVYYTNSARGNNAGFQVYGAVTAFNYVNFNYTVDENGAVMMRYAGTTPTVNAVGCSFNSSTYTLGSDSNIDIRNGTFNFTAYSGTYSGEARDFDNGGTATWFYNITGKVFEDNNFAGTASDYVSEVGDKALANVDVELYTSAGVYQSSATTDASGNYSFTNIASGSYKVRVRSATLADANTTPKDGFNACVPGTCAYPIPEMTWEHGAARYGGQSATVDDTATGDNAGPGDTYVNVADTDGDTSAVNFGFAYNLIGNVQDSGQGSLRQFLLNAKALASAAGGSSRYAQFRMQVATNQSSGGNAWWRISPTSVLPSIVTASTSLDGTTQTSNGGDNNTLGPEIEINGASAGAVDGITATSVNNTIKGLTINGYSGASKAAIRLTSASASSNLVAGNYIGTTAIGTAASANYWGIAIDTSAVSNGIGGTATGEGNTIGLNGGPGVYLDNASTTANKISGNTIFSNTGLGIDIAPAGIGTGSGANNNKARPTISVITANGANFDITATVTSGDTIEFFRVNNAASPAVSPDSTGSGEGYLYLGSCVDNGACSGPYLSGASDANGTAGTVKITLTAAGVSAHDYVTATAYDATNGTSEFAANMFAPILISGTVYIDEGTTNIGAGKTVRLLINGASVGTATTDASGNYSISAAPNAGDTLLVFISGDATYKGSTVSVSDSNALTGLNIYAGYVIARHDNGGSLSNPNIGTAKGAYAGGDAGDIYFSVAAGALTVSNSATLYVPSGAFGSFTPDGNVTTPAMKSLGTFGGGANSMTVNGALTVADGTYTATSGTTSIAGNFTVSAGTFTHNSGSISLLTNALTVDIGAATLNHATINLGAANALTVTGTMTVGGNLTLTSASAINTGTIAAAGNVTTTAAAAATTASGTILFNGSGAQTLNINGAAGTGYEGGGEHQQG